jgi:hypothetical protein
VAPPASRKGGLTEAAEPLLTVDGVDKMYHQPAEIDVIITVQLAECAHWRQSDPATSPVRAGAGQ